MVHELLIEKASFSDPIAKFAALHNLQVNKFENTDWIRIRPPEVSEITISVQDSRFIKFIQVGTVITVTRADDSHFKHLGTCTVDVQCAGDVIVWSLQNFLETFVKVISQEKWSNSDRHFLKQKLSDC